MDTTDAGDLARHAELIDHETGVRDTVDQILAGAIDYVGDAVHATVTTTRERHHVVLGSSSALAAEAARSQFEAGQGPVLDAFAEDTWLRSGDVTLDPRWPRWGPRAAELGLRSVLMMQLLAHRRPVGALTLYAEEADVFADLNKIDLALLFAGHAGTGLSATRVIEGLEIAVSSRQAIGMAQGILLERFNLDPAGAWSVLRRLSTTSNRKVNDIAEEIVRTRKIPEIRASGRPAP
ncbi:GAF and ANTAR domain-containing protein [Serinibacter arcticus]|uniref:ANTAR domain-containing protein n=1 Tax=Serinibacter arcticus TaxID=1655435 RepID=A0A4Z1DZV4_9MICO|nr:GAF and ANTAR domain-containing protein [Serinibacter arcticus]TGO03872.1 hypothetical protein SERN_2884 [Serinibacter arcticus]